MKPMISVKWKAWWQYKNWSLTSLEIFPNPTNSFLYLNALFSHGQKGEVKVYNLLGQALFDIPFDGQEVHLEFDFSNKPAGTYLLVMVTDEGVVGEKVLVLHWSQIAGILKMPAIFSSFYYLLGKAIFFFRTGWLEVKSNRTISVKPKWKKSCKSLK